MLVVPLIVECSSVTVEPVLREMTPPSCHTRQGGRERGQRAPTSQAAAPMPEEHKARQAQRAQQQRGGGPYSHPCMHSPKCACNHAISSSSTLAHDACSPTNHTSSCTAVRGLAARHGTCASG